jgi:hypothetical protein
MKLDPLPFWRRQYLTRYEQLLETYPPEMARHHAATSITACAIFNVVSPFMLAAAAAGGVAIPKEVLIGLAAVCPVGFIGLVSYIQISESLEEQWRQYLAQSADEKARRRLGTSLYVWASVAVMVVSVGLVFWQVHR